MRHVTRLASWLGTGVLAPAIGFGTPQPAAASFTQFNSRATFDALGPFIPVDWSVFGPAGTVISTPDFRVVDGLTIGVTSSQGALARHDEGNGFLGDFAPGDHLMTDAGSESDSFIVSFGTPVRGFGTQIDSHYLTGPFSGSVEVFGPGSMLLYNADFSGTLLGAEDNSAPFVGVLSSSANISFAAFLIDQSGIGLPPAGAVGINRLDVLAVPEPMSLALFLPALVAIGAMRRRDRALVETPARPASLAD